MGGEGHANRDWILKADFRVPPGRGLGWQSVPGGRLVTCLKALFA